LLFFHAPGRGEEPPLVVLLSIDGLKPDYVLEAGKHGLKVPNLRRLVAEGLYATGVTGVVPTVTYPSHATMVTGVSPARHGIFANHPVDPFGKNHGGWTWYAEDLRVPALWDAAAEAGLTTAAVHWPVNVAARIKWNIVQYWRAGTPDDRKLIRALSTPGLVAEAESALGDYPDGIAEDLESDVRRAAFNAWMIGAKKPHLHLAYLTALDHEQHERGPYTPEVFAVLERIDALVGDIRTAAEKVPGRRVYLCVVSDHGHIKVDKTLNLNAALRRAGLIDAGSDGKLKSWQAWAWVSGASAAIMLNDGADRGKVRAALRKVAGDPANGVLRLVEPPELERLGGFPGAAFLVGVRPGFQIGGGLDGPLAEPMPAAKGTHGFLPELADMDAAFFLAGPGVPRGRNLGRIDMRDIAPTVAALLGVTMPQAEGRNRLR
jgi:predicted AlkP superfamily pyrophosphatase or phosphodiesterase